MLNLMSLLSIFVYLRGVGKWGYWLNKISILYFLYYTLNIIYYDMLHAFFFLFLFLDFSYFIRKVKGKICNKL